MLRGLLQLRDTSDVSHFLGPVSGVGVKGESDVEVMVSKLFNFHSIFVTFQTLNFF